MIDSFLLLSPSNQILLEQTYTTYISSKITESLIKTLNDYQEKQPPIIHISKYAFFVLSKANHLFIVATRSNISTITAFSVLSALYSLIKSFVPEITPSKINHKRTLLLEVLDEAIDFGFPQLISPEQISPFLFAGKKTNMPDFLFKSNILTEESTKGEAISSQNFEENKRLRAYVSVSERLVIVLSEAKPSVHSESPKKDLFEQNDFSNAIEDFEQGEEAFSEGGQTVCEELALVGEVNCDIRGNVSRLGSDYVLLLNGETKSFLKMLEASVGVKLHPCVALDRWKEAGRLIFSSPGHRFKLLEYKATQRSEDLRRESAGKNKEAKGLLEFEGGLEEALRMSLVSPVNFFVRRNVFSGVITLSVTLGFLVNELFCAKNVRVAIPVPKTISKIQVRSKKGTVKYIASRDVLEWKISRLKGLKNIGMQAKLRFDESQSKRPTDYRPAEVSFEMKYWTLSNFVVNSIDSVKGGDSKMDKWVTYNTPESKVIFKFKDALW